MKKIMIIAGPNGAGKTTFARAFLPAEAQCPHFVNADLIAAGLSPFAPELAAMKAGRLMLREMSEHAVKDESFAFETTLSGLGYLQHIRRWRAQGYRRRRARSARRARCARACHTSAFCSRVAEFRTPLSPRG